MIIFIVPKNSGLELAREIAKEYSGEIVEVRGRDIPYFVSKLIKKNKRVIGITGEDLFKEFCLENKNTELEIIKEIAWQDESFVFKKPALCLLGPKNKRLEELPKQLKVCINKKYKELAKKYCTNLLENKGYTLEKIYASGMTEEFFSKGLADLVIEIVCSGKSAKEYNLDIYDKLFESDIVIIGGKNDNPIN